VEGCASATATLLRDAELRTQKGEPGHERVRREFLTPRLLREDLELIPRAARSVRKPRFVESRPRES
jgi:hypothetical protein